jgi:DNA polymerase-1
MADKLLLIDGHSMAYRAFFALPAENFTTASGQHTNAIYGFATMLISLLKEEKPTHIAVAFDVSRKTFRTEMFPDYKANRAKTPDEFRSQMSFLNELVSAFGIRQFAQEGFEADDIIATLSVKAGKEKLQVLICTGDRDSFQLVNENTTVLYPKRGVSDLSRMTPDAVLTKYGLTPEQYPDFAALRGDPSDNLPSIPGVGEKTATKWIVDFGSLTALIKDVDKVSGKVGESLRENIDIVLRNRELTQLRHDVVLDTTLSDLKWNGPNVDLLDPLFEQLEFRTLKERVAGILGVTSAPKVSSPMAGLFDSETVSESLSAEEVSKAIAAAIGEIALGYEIEGEVVLRYCLATGDGKTFNVEGNEFGPWLSDPSIKKVLHDGKALSRITPVAGIVFDTSLAAYLLNPGVRSQELTDIVSKWGSGQTLPPPDSAEFLTQGTAALLGLHENLERELNEKGLLALYRDLELPVADLLAVMERRGIAVDQAALVALQDFFTGEVNRETAQAHSIVGHEFNLASPKQLQVVLFEELKLPKTNKIKTGYTTDAESLEWLMSTTSHPLLAALLRVRETSKLKTTVAGLNESIASDGRIHTHLQQTVAATGRLSSVAPNLQNIPVRTEEGRRIRECFVAADGYSQLLTADYSQIEMRIMAHLSQDKELLAAFHSGEDLHSSVAAIVFGVAATDVDPEMRRKIKAMSYGLAYGLSSYGLSAQLGISPGEAQSLMDTYFLRFGGIREYLQRVVEEARKVGYTETVLGRRRYLPDLNHDNKQRREVAERMALNAPIQGSAADIIKVAMLNVEKAITAAGLKARMLLQVHDELIFEVNENEVEALSEIVRLQMGSAYPLNAPLEVNIGIGSSWNAAAH